VIALADARGYLPAGTLLIKRVIAGDGDLACRLGAIVAVNGQPVAHASAADRLGRPLPRWSGCKHLAAGAVLLLSPVPDSFDGRYFGPLDGSHVLGTALPLWANSDWPSPAGRRP
jgi:type IV secretory pathway protease TraF